MTELKEQVEQALGDIRPALQADGGDIELVDVKDGVVQVRLQGACAGCPMSQLTLANGVERHLKNVVPGVERVENMAGLQPDRSTAAGELPFGNRPAAV